MGTLVVVEAEHATQADAHAAVEAAFQRIRDIEGRMHPHCSGSDLAKINNAAVGELVPVHASTLHLLQLAKRLHELTQGVFDPTLPKLPGRLSDLAIVDLPGASQVSCHAPLALDFGGFAKGFAVDEAIRALMQAHCHAGLVNAGGDIRVFGERSDAVLMRGPDGTLREVALDNAALAVTHTQSRNKPPEHQGYYIRPPRTAAATAPLPNLTFAAVIAPEAALADALVKCVLLSAPSSAEQALREFGASTLQMS